jgi:zinc transporter ZupT
MQALAQLLLSVAMYSVMGATAGLGIAVARRYPQVGEFLRRRPVLGWMLAFTAGSVVVTATLTAVEYVAFWLLTSR